MCLSGLSFTQVMGFGAGTKREGGWVSSHVPIPTPSAEKVGEKVFSARPRLPTGLQYLFQNTECVVSGSSAEPVGWVPGSQTSGE